MSEMLTKRQVAHFKKMSRGEREDVIRDSHRQMDYISMSNSPGADHKRAQLEAYIAFCKKLNRAT